MIHSPVARSLAAVAAVTAAGWVAMPAAQAIVIFDQPLQNTSAPVDDRGYKSVARFSNGAAVAVGTHTFLTTKHLPVLVGQDVVLNGQTYNVQSWYDTAPGSEIRVLRVDGPVPGSLIAPLYTNPADPAGLTVSIVGHGGPKGVTNDGSFDLTGHGWYWTNRIATASWGMNTLTGITSGWLHFNFDQAVGASEGIFTDGDSGGGLFIDDGGTWKLAGITEGVDAFYTSQTETNPYGYLHAAIYDPKYFSGATQTGLWEGNIGSLALTSLDSQGGYANQIVSRLTEIQGLIATSEAVPEPASLGVLALAAAGLLLRRRRM